MIVVQSPRTGTSLRPAITAEMVAAEVLLLGPCVGFTGVDFGSMYLAARRHAGLDAAQLKRQLPALLLTGRLAEAV